MLGFFSANKAKRIIYIYMFVVARNSLVMNEKDCMQKGSWKTNILEM